MKLAKFAPFTIIAATISLIAATMLPTPHFIIVVAVSGGPAACLLYATRCS